jgi:transcriptional regulator with XRE-family HTH domain
LTYIIWSNWYLIIQVELARELNITSQSLSQYELGRRTPDIDMINKLADFFNVSVDYLLGRTHCKNSCGILEVETPAINSSDIEIIDEINNLSPESQEDLESYLKLLKFRDMQKRNSKFNDSLATIDRLNP